MLAKAEHRLRARGLTGARAFEVLVDALTRRLEGTDADDDLLAALPVDEDTDLLGLAYERFFADVFKGLRGQFFTPRPLVELLLQRAEVGAGDVVLDPTCGSGGFLVCAARRGAEVRGIELDPQLARLAALNLRLGQREGQVVQGDFFAADPDPVDVVVANPPFSVTVDDADLLARYTVRGQSDWMFVEALPRWVKPGGRAAIVLPWSIVVNPTWADLRRRIDDAFVRTALCALPEGVFRPFGGAAGRACLLWLRRRPTDEQAMQWAVLDNPGYDPRSTRYLPTGDQEVEALAAGQGWQTLSDDAWTPSVAASGTPVSQLATHRHVIRRNDGSTTVIELADADKRTGEVIPSVVELQRRKLKIEVRAADVLVSRLRPALGNVAIAPVDAVGSTEWIPLQAERPHMLLHALRTPTWRSQLPVTSGQTRPRTSADAVLASRVAWPSDPDVVERIDRVSREIFTARAALRERLIRLQDLVDRFAAGDLDEAALAAALDDV